MSIKFKLTKGAKLPVRGSERAAGLDLCSAEERVLLVQNQYLFMTGLILADCPQDIELEIAPRSKLANKHGIVVLGGVVDNDYRGELGVILLNTSNSPVTILKGEAIAQLVQQKIAYYPVEEAIEVTTTGRGTAGIHSEDMRRGVALPHLCDSCNLCIAACASKVTYDDGINNIITCDLHEDNRNEH